MAPFEPKDPMFRERVSASFNRQKVMRTLGITIERLDPGEVELAMQFADAYTQQHGFLHAGIIATALDSACGYAAFSLMSADAAVLTVEFKINLLAPAKGESFRFVGHVLKPGRTLTVCQAHAFARQGPNEIQVATVTGTLMAIHGRDGVVG
jgi:uncharacterized protein (TIGR00369 family)